MSAGTPYDLPWYTRLLSSISSRERELAARCALLELEKQQLTLRLEVEELRSEQLALLNEQLRRWILASTAATVGLEKMLGAPEGKQR